MTTEPTTPPATAGPDAPRTDEHLLFEGGGYIGLAGINLDKLPDDQLAFYKEELTPGRFWGLNREGKRVWYDMPPEKIRLAHDEAKKAIAMGHRPRIQNHHYQPSKFYGQIVDVRLNDRGGLETKRVFNDKASRNEALSMPTSVCLTPKEDLYGNKYQLWLDHSAVVPRPQHSYLRDYEVALSAAGHPVEAIYLSAGPPPDPTGAPPQKDPPMDLTRLRAALGDAAKDKPDDQVLALAADAITNAPPRLDLTALRGAFAPDVTAGKSDADVVALASDAIPHLNGHLTQVQEQLETAMALAAEQPTGVTTSAATPELDPRVRGQLVEGIDDARKMALHADAPKALIDDLDGLFMSGGSANELALSASGENNMPVARQVYRLLAKHLPSVIATQNRVPRTGEPVGTTRTPIAMSADPNGAGADEVATAGKSLAEEYNKRNPVG